MARLEPLRAKSRSDFDRDPYLRDIVERNLEMAAQCVIDISHRIIALTGAPKPHDYYGAILQMGELGVVPPEFALRVAPLAGLRNILIHEYLKIDWDEVYKNLESLAEISAFADFVRQWLKRQVGGSCSGGIN